ncbi:MAG: Fic family protein [Moraxella sp.]|nr:Fic family protein [Moraxella sp.]
MTDYGQVKALLSKTPTSHKEAEEQEKLERAVTSVREKRLDASPIQGSYDLVHLLKIHSYIFDGLYDHAGQLRPQTENWGKQNSHDPSLYSEFLPISEGIQAISETSQFLQENDFLKNFDRDDFVYEFTVSYAEFNSAHPFEEGNGRAIRIMFKQLAEQAGYQFNTKNISKEEWDRASALSGTHFVLYEDGKGGFTGVEQNINIEPLLEIMEKSLIEKSKL